MMLHLFHDVVDIRRQIEADVDGASSYTYQTVLTGVPCRFDLVFQRPGRDDLRTAEGAGRVPDRQGVCFMEATVDVRIGDRLILKPGSTVSGVFELQFVPDQAPGLSAINHLEFQVIEVPAMVAQ